MDVKKFSEQIVNLLKSWFAKNIQMLKWVQPPITKCIRIIISIKQL